MERAAHPAPRMHRLTMPWGFVTALEVFALALISAGLVLDVFPSTFDVEWGCVGTSGKMHTSADTYVAAFTVLGGLGWLLAISATAILHASGRRVVALLVPLVWFAGLVLVAFAIASAIGPQTC